MESSDLLGQKLYGWSIAQKARFYEAFSEPKWPFNPDVRVDEI